MNTKNLSFKMLTLSLLMLGAAMPSHAKQQIRIVEEKPLKFVPNPKARIEQTIVPKTISTAPKQQREITPDQGEEAKKFSTLPTESGDGQDYIWLRAMGFDTHVMDDVKKALQKKSYEWTYSTTRPHDPERVAVINAALTQRCDGINNLRLPQRGREALQNALKIVADNFNVSLTAIQCKA